MNKEPKDVEVKARVTSTMREKLEVLAGNESLSVVVREAIEEYLEKPENIVKFPSPRQKVIYPKSGEKKKRRA
jgi:predicted DNA-binding protein